MRACVRARACVCVCVVEDYGIASPWNISIYMYMYKGLLGSHINCPFVQDVYFMHKYSSIIFGTVFSSITTMTAQNLR